MFCRVRPGIEVVIAAERKRAEHGADWRWSRGLDGLLGDEQGS